MKFTIRVKQLFAAADTIKYSLPVKVVILPGKGSLGSPLPGDSILLQGVDDDGDIAVNVTMSEYGGEVRVSSSDAAKLDPNAITSSVLIAPARDVALEAVSAASDTLVKITMNMDSLTMISVFGGLINQELRTHQQQDW